MSAGESGVRLGQLFRLSLRTPSKPMKSPPIPAEVAAVFRNYSPPIKTCLIEVRQLIFSVAASTEGVGPLSETLKWGEPAYLTEISKSGSTIRLGRVSGRPDLCAIYFNCQTTLLDSFRTQFADVLTLAGDRAIILDPGQALQHLPLQICLSMALTYHRAKQLAIRRQARRVSAR